MERLSLDFAELSKRCSSCGQTKGNADFNKRNRSKDGLQAWCRECERAAHAKRYAQNPQATGATGLGAERRDQSLPWPYPQSQSLDHLIPLARGGRHTRSNSQITHLICNLRRGIKPMVTR